MSSRNFDSSRLTQIRRDRAVYTNARDTNAAVQNGETIRVATAGNPTASVVVEQRDGACQCNTTYNPSNPCNCGSINNQ